MFLFTALRSRLPPYASSAACSIALIVCVSISSPSLFLLFKTVSGTGFGVPNLASRVRRLLEAQTPNVERGLDAPRLAIPALQ